MRAELDALKQAWENHKAATKVVATTLQGKVVSLSSQLGTDFSPEVAALVNEILTETTAWAAQFPTV